MGVSNTRPAIDPKIPLFVVVLTVWRDAQARQALLAEELRVHARAVSNLLALEAAAWLEGTEHAI